MFLDAAFVSMIVVLVTYLVAVTPPALTGILERLRKLTPSKPGVHAEDDLPTISIIIAAKDDEPTISAMLESLVQANYPKSKLDITVAAEDPAPDTLQTCLGYQRRYGYMRVITLGGGTGKPRALNYALSLSSGEMVMVMDADTVLPPAALSSAVEVLMDEKVAAVTAMHSYTNERQNVLTRLSRYEATVYRVESLGRQRLSQFIPIVGFFAILRRSVLERIGTWNENSVTEDFDLSVRLVRAGYRTKIVDMEVGQEAPPSVGGLFRQRVRWYRGGLDTGVRNLDLWRRLNLLRTMDILLTAFSPVLGLVAILSSILLLAQQYFYVNPAYVQTLVILLNLFFAMYVSVVTAAEASSRTRGWLVRIILAPLAILHSVILAFAASYAVLTKIAGIKVVWSRTERSGLTGPRWQPTMARTRLMKRPRVRLQWDESPYGPRGS